nr:DUF3795 domain-containing protein [uncultured Methanobrevibacter sp.]
MQFKRKDLLFSLCGLNCSLCPSFVQGTCPGCRAGSHCAAVCPFAPCSVEHGNVSYCFECGEYPCRHYDGVDKHDSLITHKNQLKDIEKAKQIGIDKYHEEQTVKKQILDELLDNYDVGNKEIFLCLAVNLLDIEDLKDILNKADLSTKDMDLADKYYYIKQLFNDCGEKRGIELKLRRDGYYG